MMMAYLSTPQVHRVHRHCNHPGEQTAPEGGDEVEPRHVHACRSVAGLQARITQQLDDGVCAVKHVTIGPHLRLRAVLVQPAVQHLVWVHLAPVPKGVLDGPVSNSGVIGVAWEHTM